MYGRFAGRPKKSGGNNEETVLLKWLLAGVPLYLKFRLGTYVPPPPPTGRLYLVRCGGVEVSNDKGIQLLA